MDVASKLRALLSPTEGPAIRSQPRSPKPAGKVPPDFAGTLAQASLNDDSIGPFGARRPRPAPGTVSPAIHVGRTTEGVAVGPAGHWARVPAPAPRLGSLPAWLAQGFELFEIDRGGGIARRAVLRPILQRAQARILKRLFRRIEIAKIAQQRRRNPVKNTMRAMSNPPCSSEFIRAVAPRINSLLQGARRPCHNSSIKLHCAKSPSPARASGAYSARQIR